MSPLVGSQTTMDDIRKAFQKFDKDGNGSISFQEAHQVLNQELGFSTERTKTLLQVYDRNDDHQLSYEEFIWFYWKVQEKKEELAAIFRRFDSDGNRKVTFDEARAVLGRLGFSDMEIRDLIRIHDKNQDGCLQYEEFVQFWGACGGKLPRDPLSDAN